jgi:hypothetical protein
VPVVPLVDVEVELLVVLPPHPATANVAARTASSVSMAASDVRFIGRPPVVALLPAPNVGVAHAGVDFGAHPTRHWQYPPRAGGVCVNRDASTQTPRPERALYQDASTHTPRPERALW